MPAKKKSTKQAAKPDEKNNLIKTLSEVEALSDKEKEAFRLAGGTTINNPN